MNKFKNPKVCGLQSAADLRAELAAAGNSDAKNQLKALFDENTFVEISAFMQRGISDFLTTEVSKVFEGVISGYGSIDGRLVFAFAEDVTRMGGVIDEKHAKKIADLYKLALSNGAPVVGIFNSNGTDIFQGTAGLAAYGRIISAVNSASGVVPQIAYVAGNCIGTAAAIAAMFDVVVKNDKATLYVTSPALTGVDKAQDAVVSYCADEAKCLGYIKGVVSFLPDNATNGVQVSDCTDDLNRMLGEVDFAGDALSAISVIADNGLFYEVGSGFATNISTVFATVGGVKCGIVATSFANDEGRLNSNGARKVAKFVNLCNSFSIPVVTLNDSMGLAIDKDNENIFAPELAKLACAYASATIPTVTVILGHAIGASFTLLGSKSLGADLVYCLDSSEIGALCAESGVAFAWDKYITEEKTRDELVGEWKASVSSPVVAAASGEIDDIIGISELRARICSALLMLSAKGVTTGTKARKVLPL